jgi:PAS domain S-box-containing protein
MRQEYLLMLGPVVSVLLFVTALAASLVYLRSEEVDAELEAVTRDVNFTHREIRLRVADRLGQITRMAQDIEPRRNESEFLFQAAILASQYPELIGLSTLNRDGGLRATYVMVQAHDSQLRDREARVQAQAREARFALSGQRGVLFAPPYTKANDPLATTTVMAYLKLTDGGRAANLMAVEFQLDALLRASLSDEVAQRYGFAIVDAQGRTLAGQLPAVRDRWSDRLPWVHATPEYRTALQPLAPELWLVGRGYRSSPDFAAQALQWATVVLSLLTLWMLVTNWRHAKRRLKTQRAFMIETQFRRAMEDSMLTGMRAMDMQGRITYVNPAFCRMTGWSEAELVGQHPPFSFWPDEDHALLMERLEHELQGMVNQSGFEVRLMRRSGETFFARMYMSPLVSQSGEQTGWMASVADITESKRTREELAAAHERFTTVLGSLDAAVSVANIGGNALLFGNARYRQWFGDSVLGHHRMVAHAQLSHAPNPSDDTDEWSGLPTHSLLDADSEDAILFDPQLNIWLEVRSRYLTWVDGSLAQMVISTDVTARHEAQAQAQAHAEKAEAASRLITMGEMASTVAHELNQPLAAISNYCSGMISRLKRQQMSSEDLVPALEKTAKQAQRAGQIISRIRAFVKRSEPTVTRTSVHDIVNDALELAQLELRRQDVRLSHYIDARLPDIMADPILIEQVLINLIKNGAESVQQAKRPQGEREVNLRVQSCVMEGQRAVEFRVRDSGSGIPEAMRERIYDAFFSTKSEGMGIGLKLCRSIVESHHGRMAVENLYNGDLIVGCCFSFWLPVSNRVDASLSAPGDSTL